MKRSNWLPAPQSYLLNQMCVIINEAFGDFGCYLVGSSIHKRDYRDVDVRFIMKDAKYDELFGTNVPAHMNPLWSLMCTSISLFLQTHTGLPIDFQIQKMVRANSEDGDKERHPLGAFVCPTSRDYADPIEHVSDAQPAIVVGVQACTECGGSGEGTDKCDGPGDVYQGKCGRCNGTGIEPG